MEFDFLTALANRIPVAAIVCDSEGQNLVFNTAARELFPDGTLARDHPLFRALQGYTVSGLEMIIAPIGEPVSTATVDAHPITDKNGILIGAIATFMRRESGGASANGTSHASAAAKPDLRSTPDRRRLFAEISRALSSSLHLDTLLQNFANAAIDDFSDWCMVDLLEQGALMRRVAMAHRSAEQLAIAKEIDQRYPAAPEDPVSRVVRTGTPELVPRLSDGLLETVAQDSEHFRLLRSLAVQSYMIVPLITGSQTLGAVTFVSGDPKRCYDENDLQAAEQMAAQASVAISLTKLHSSGKHG